MILIADSGSTKTDWRLIDEFNNIHQAQTIGLNPYFSSEEEIIDAVTTGPINLFSPEDIRAVHFYSSGCSSLALISKMEQALGQVYKSGEIYVEHDLLGAARALCGRESGIAAILGTGSNSCMFDGSHIVKNIPSLGYILGDEGSGAYMGKQFLADLFNGSVPDGMRKKFEGKFKLDREQVLENIYIKPFPSRFLASFVRFLYQNLEQEYTKTLVSDSFKAFFTKQISKYHEYKKYPLHVVGAVAFKFNAILRYVAEEEGITLGQVIQSPIAALTLYHLNEKE